jgi:hypothetical protein
MNYKCLVFYLCRVWKVAVGKVFNWACGRILLKAKATCALHVADGLGVEAKVPYDLVAVARYDGASSIGSGELHQEGGVPVAMAHPRYRASRRALVDSVARERPTMKTTPHDELLRHRFDHNVFNHDALLSSQRLN